MCINCGVNFNFQLSQMNRYWLDLSVTSASSSVSDLVTRKLSTPPIDQTNLDCQHFDQPCAGFPIQEVNLQATAGKIKY